MATAAPLGTIVHLWRYPTKSLAPVALDSAEFDERGLRGDRERALFVASPGHARTGRTYRGKEHERLHTAGSTDAAIALAAARDLKVDVRGNGPHFDAAPVSLLFDTWLAEVERLVGRRLEAQRFRPNLVVHAAAEFRFAEADLAGRTLAAGTVQLYCTAPIERCVTPSYDLQTGRSDPHVLRTIARERNNIIGIYCTVAVAGTIGLGDRIAWA